MLIPLSDATKAKGDALAVTTSALAFFQMIPWAEVAAFLACVYTVLRIVELVTGWFRKE